MYFRLRMYSSELGQFLQRDPIGYLGGMNLYRYVVGNPTRWMDPFGIYGITDVLVDIGEDLADLPGDVADTLVDIGEDLADLPGDVADTLVDIGEELIDLPGDIADTLDEIIEEDSSTAASCQLLLGVYCACELIDRCLPKDEEVTLPPPPPPKDNPCKKE